MDLLERLRNLQQSMGLTDKAFARELNISRVLWWRTKNRDLGIGIRLLRGTYRRFPELVDAILFFLAQDVTIHTDKVTARTMPKKPHLQVIGGKNGDKVRSKRNSSTLHSKGQV